MRRLAAFLFGLAWLPAAAAQPPSPPGARQLGPVRPFRGVYVTNFEIGYFIECDPARGECDNWVHREFLWLHGADGHPAMTLMACIARWNGSRDRWALYAIDFEGQESLDRQPKRFLHDTERWVYLHRLATLEMIGTDETVDRELPRYRRLPAMRC